MLRWFDGRDLACQRKTSHLWLHPLGAFRSGAPSYNALEPHASYNWEWLAGTVLKCDFDHRRG